MVSVTTAYEIGTVIFLMPAINLPVNYDNLRPSQKRVVREEYVKVQDGKCYHCGAPIEGRPSKEVLQKKVTAKFYPPSFFNNPVHLHHNHDTGMTIGAVHCYCNAVLWEHHGE